MTGPLKSQAFEVRLRAPHWFVFGAIFWLAVGPRIEVLDFAGSSLRIEDLLLAGLAAMSIAQWGQIRRIPIGRTGIGLVTVVSVVAALVGSFAGNVHGAAALLYAVRPIEYWFVLPALVWALHTGGPRARPTIVAIVAFATVVHTAVAAGQYLFGFSIGFSAFALTRGAGLTNGPYELGAIMSMVVCFWIAERRLVLALLAIAGMLMSLSRISIVGAVLGIAIYALVSAYQSSRVRRSDRVKPKQKPKPTTVIAVTVMVSVVIVAVPTIGAKLLAPAVDRTHSTSLAAAWRTGEERASITPSFRSSDAYAAVAYGAIGTTVLDNVTTSDASNEVRFYRWNLLLNEVKTSPVGWVIGLGPSFAGPSVDGAFLRVIVESGLIGLVAWFLMIVRWLRRSPAWFVGATTALLVGNVFIDLFYAERPMVFFWVLLGLVVMNRASRRDEEGVS